MPVETLKKFLDEHDVKYVTTRHSKAFTAQEVADSAHIPGREMAKTVIVHIDGKLAMLVLPAPAMVDLEVLRDVTGARSVELATEKEFGGRFSNCELGAMPPFGNLWDMPVFVDASLRERDRIAFNAGSHTELIQLGYADFERLVNPTVLEFATQRA